MIIICKPIYIKWLDLTIQLHISKGVVNKSQNQMDKVVKKVCMRHGYSITELRSQGRSPELILARKEAMTELRKLDFSYNSIGKYMHRHHSTVMNAIDEDTRRRTKFGKTTLKKVS
ncbi:MAG: helix-turn-helix domain-containing protein [Cyclobacteriaceae bacterium]